jgi:predicted nucleic acid-binding protein
MLVALNTNILAYAEGAGDALRCEQAIRLIEQLPVNQVLLPAQTLGELFRVLTGKVKREPGLSRMAIMAWADSFIIGDSSWSAFQAAMDLAGRYCGKSLCLTNLPAACQSSSNRMTRLKKGNAWVQLLDMLPVLMGIKLSVRFCI